MDTNLKSKQKAKHKFIGSTPISLASLFVVINILVSLLLGQTPLITIMAEKSYFKSSEMIHALADLTCYIKRQHIDKEELNNIKFEQLGNLTYVIDKQETSGFRQVYTNDTQGIVDINDMSTLEEKSRFYYHVTFNSAKSYTIDSSLETYQRDDDLFQYLLHAQIADQDYDNIEVYYFILDNDYETSKDFVYKNIKEYERNIRVGLMIWIQILMLILWSAVILMGALKNHFKEGLWQWPKRVPIEVQIIGLFWLWHQANRLYGLLKIGYEFQYFFEDYKAIIRWHIGLIIWMCLLAWYIIEGVQLFKEKSLKGIKAQSLIIKHKEKIKWFIGELYGVVGIDIRKRYPYKVIGYSILHTIGLFILAYLNYGYGDEVILCWLLVLVGIRAFMTLMYLRNQIVLVKQIQQVKDERIKVISVRAGFKAVSGMIAYVIGLVIISMVSYNEFEIGLILSLLLAGVMMFLNMNRIRSYHQLYNYVEEIAVGKETHKPPHSFLSPIIDELSKLDTDFKAAVNQEVISQRMKTELISNVSHDLKTPLTSIINYVDLLKNEDLTKDQQKEYIQILDQKSKRLKILIEDLFEASKTASGNIDLVKEQVDIVALLKQTMGELTEKITASELKFRVNLPEEKVYCQLDGRRTYRIFENLISNILKYAEPGSRVYIDCEQLEQQKVSVTFRNISAYEMHFSAEEIMERFKRGDESRHTEGSGLGLAIAKNLTELQDGKFEVFIDGDLFKVIVIFPYETKNNDKKINE